MPDDAEGCGCARDCCDAPAPTEVDLLMYAFLDCDHDGLAEFGAQECRRLRAALRRDKDALQRFFDLLVQDMILGEVIKEQRTT